MTKFAALCATALALATPGIAQAASPDGDHIFKGTVEVRKNIPTWSTCEVTAVVNVAAGVPKLKSVSLTGPAPCPGIVFTGLPSGPIIIASPVGRVPIIGIITPPLLIFPTDACLGELMFTWGGNSATPRTITFVDGLSNVPDGNPDNVGATENACRLRGTLVQTSTPPLNL
jgi:hypothetical protein